MRELGFTIGEELMSSQGKPHGWMRVVPVVFGQRARLLTPKREREYQAAVKVVAIMAARRMSINEALTCPVEVEIVATYRRPKSMSKSKPKAWAAVKPDADNIAKSILDAMEPQVISDDKQVIRLTVLKRYAIEGERQSVRVTVREVEEWARLKQQLFTFRSAIWCLGIRTRG